MTETYYTTDTVLGTFYFDETLYQPRALPALYWISSGNFPKENSLLMAVEEDTPDLHYWLFNQGEFRDARLA